MSEVSTQSKIGFLDLKGQHEQIKEEVFQKWQEVYAKTAFSGGPFVQEFESKMAKACGTEYALGVNSGTSALHLALLAMGIGPGDEVIVPANTFIATAWSVSYVGAKLIFVDCDPDTWNIDANAVAKAITPHTKAVIGVHLYGQPFDVDAVKAICDPKGIGVIEDAAQAFGARYKGKNVGGLAEMACFSFYPGKNLGACGEGGGISTSNEKYYMHIQSLRNHGSMVKYEHRELGFNMRMGGLEGASLTVKADYIESWNNQRRKIAEAYFEGIQNPKVKLQHQPEFSDSVYHLFVAAPDNREAFVNHLNTQQIFPGMHYPIPCHLQEAYASLGHSKGDFPHSEQLADHCVSLPMYAELTHEQVQRVIDAVNSY